MLSHLTDDDYRLLWEQARHVCVPEREVILEEHSTRRALFFISSGTVRVERAQLGRGIACARLGPGEIFGEMSFLESTGASAAVIAEEEVELEVLDAWLVDSLVRAVPGFAGRFYQSLAVNLSRRLRETTAHLPPLLVEQVPQVNRFHAPRTSGERAHLSRELVDGVDQFARTVHASEHEAARGAGPDELQPVVSGALSALNELLRREIARAPQDEATVGTYVFRETFSTISLSALADRAFAKPRGYSGDFLTFDLMHRDEPRGDGPIGPLIDRWLLSEPVVRTVRLQRQTLTSTIRRMAEARSASALRVTSLASGSAPEVLDALRALDGRGIRVTCIDLDPEALACLNERAARRGVQWGIALAQDDVLRLAQRHGRVGLLPQHLIYSLGLLEYLPDDRVVALLDWVHEMLVPGGTVLLGSVHPANPDRALLDHVLEWRLIHRTVEDMEELFARSRFGVTAVESRIDDTGVGLCTSATRS